MLTYSSKKHSYSFNPGYGHSKINQLGEKSKLTKSTVLQTKRSMQNISLPQIHSNKVQNKSSIKVLPFTKNQRKPTLLFRNQTSLEHSKTETNNPQFDQLEQEKIIKNQILVKKIQELKQMHLFDKAKLKNVRYQGESNGKAIMNDFHCPKTNGGFSRSKTGGIYYK